MDTVAAAERESSSLRSIAIGAAAASVLAVAFDALYADDGPTAAGPREEAVIAGGG